METLLFCSKEIDGKAKSKRMRKARRENGKAVGNRDGERKTIWVGAVTELRMDFQKFEESRIRRNGVFLLLKLLQSGTGKEF